MLVDFGPLRRDPNKLLELFVASKSKFLVFQRGSVLFDCATKAIVEFEYPSVKSVFRDVPPIHPSILVVFLGLDEGLFKSKGDTYWALQITCADVLSEGVKEFIEAKREGRSFQSLRPAAFNLSPPMAAIVAQARSILDWHSKNRFSKLAYILFLTPELVSLGTGAFRYLDVVAITCVISKDGQRTLLGQPSESIEVVRL
ncbi:NADH pyrophosphatase [Massospora cicadina]|nr:NADH pyrophosphatase [Massospora cicadina]